MIFVLTETKRSPFLFNDVAMAKDLKNFNHPPNVRARFCKELPLNRRQVAIDA